MSADLTALLEGLSRQRGVRGSLIASAEDGLVVAEVAMEGVETRAVAALGAALVQRLTRAAETAGYAAPSFLHVHAEQGVLLAMPAGELLLLVLAAPEINVGLARLAMREAVGQTA